MSKLEFTFAISPEMNFRAGVEANRHENMEIIVYNPCTVRVLLSSETELITQCHCVSAALAIWNEMKQSQGL